MNAKEVITFDSIIGYSQAKKELMEIKSFLLDKDMYEEKGARIPKGILLVGKPGNGKTLMVKALSKEINVPIYSYGDYSDDSEKHVKNLQKLFKIANENSPAIIFIDELDKLNENDRETDMHVVRELVTLLDGYHENKNIVVIATANSTRHMDESLLRSGRFDRIIKVGNPNFKEREELFKFYIKDKDNKDIDFKKLATVTNGLSCADIDNIINDAVLVSIREGNGTLTQEYIEKSIDRVSLKSVNTTEILEDDKKVIAIHEVGHAVVGMCTGATRLVSKISIESRGDSAGRTSYCDADEGDSVIITKSDILKKIRTFLGGYVAEEIYLGEVSLGASKDLQAASISLANMIKRYGMFGLEYTVFNMPRQEINSNRMKYKFEKKYMKLMKEAYIDTKYIIKHNNELFQKLLNKVIEKEVVFKEEIEEVVKSVKKINTIKL